LTITGNLIINGTTTSVNTTTVTTTDSLIKLANNNTVGDSLDIGFYGVSNTFGSTAPTYHGLVRQAGSNNFLLFKGLTQDPTSNVLGAGSTTAANVGTLIANVAGYSITSNGVDLYLYTTNAYTQANTATNNAAGASLYANGAFIQANAAFLVANTPSAIANSAALYANGAFTQANAAFGVANTALQRSGGQITGPVSSNNPIYASALSANSTVTINTSSILTSTLYTTTTTAQNTIFSFATATYRSAKLLTQMTSGTAYHMIELSLIHDGTTVFLSQYGEVKTGASLGTFDASIATGNMNLLFTPTNAATTIKIVSTQIPV
jgi:hypothetical protein